MINNILRIENNTLDFSSFPNINNDITICFHTKGRIVIVNHDWQGGNTSSHYHLKLKPDKTVDDSLLTDYLKTIGFKSTTSFLYIKEKNTYFPDINYNSKPSTKEKLNG